MQVSGAFANLKFPQPYDEHNPNYPAVLKEAKIPLVTKRLLVMERCAGQTVTKFGNAMLDELAEKEGMSVEEYKKDLMDKMQNDTKFAEKMLTSTPSEAQFEAYRKWLGWRDLASNVAAAVYNNTVRKATGDLPWPKKKSVLPPNGPRLMKFLYDVHGYQIFKIGSFNADPVSSG